MSEVTIRRDAPPFVTFEFMENGINAEATARSGRPIPNVTAYAKIMQHGDKFAVTEIIADRWLDELDRKVLAGTYSPDWAARFRKQYEAFLKGEELPRDGTPIRTWPAPSREQTLRLLALGITTVEDLAAFPDSGLGNIGLDGRHLRDLAKNYIIAGESVGVMAKKVADQDQTIRDQAEQIKRMSESIAALESQMPKSETIHAKK